MKPRLQQKRELHDINHSNSFMRFDIAISRPRHILNQVNGVYPSLMAASENLSIRAESMPDFSDLKNLLSKVGEEYGWDRRREYHDPSSIEELMKHLADSATSRRFTFLANGKEVGGAIIANVEKAVIEDGKPRIRRIFREAQNKTPELGIRETDVKKTIEIFKIGLHPEYTGKGWGRYFVSEVLNSLFEEMEGMEEKFDVVYLNTRSTNHRGVLDFYRRLNMHVLNVMTYKDDVLTDEEIAKYGIERAAMERSLIDEYAKLNGFKGRGPTFDREAAGMAPAI